MSRVDDEIAFHLDMLTRELIDAGMTPDEARAEAMRRFGDAERVRSAAAAAHGARVNAALTMLVLAFVACSHRLLSFFAPYAWLHAHRPYYVAESLKNVLEVGVCIGALLVMRQRRILAALGLDRRPLRALAFGLAASWPMFAGFAIAGRIAVTNWISFGYLGIFSPFAEEIAMRGFAYRSLRRAGWSMPVAALTCAMISGAAHIEKGQTAAQIAGLFTVITLGSFVFCWIVERWQSLWFPFALHALMDSSWELFKVAPTALGGWYAFALQMATIALALLITARLTRRPSPHATVGPSPPTRSLPHDRYSRSVTIVLAIVASCMFDVPS